jgi:putative proteasome-type protease
MDSTMRSNLSVGPPIELLIYGSDSFSLDNYYQLKEDSAYLKRLTQVWNEKLIEGFEQLPPLESSVGANLEQGETAPLTQPN